VRKKIQAAGPDECGNFSTGPGGYFKRRLKQLAVAMENAPRASHDVAAIVVAWLGPVRQHVSTAGAEGSKWSSRTRTGAGVWICCADG